MSYPELKLFSELLSQLWSDPSEYHGEDAKKIWRVIGTAFRSFEVREKFEQALPSEAKPKCDFADLHRFLYLEPVTKHPVMVPVLSLQSDFTKTPIELRLRVGLFLREGETVRAIGLRFEGPEGTGEGAHNFYHAQLIRFFRGDIPIPQVPSWVPQTQPSLSLRARDPVTLLIAFLVSVYGFKQLGRLVQAASPSLREQLTSYKQTLLS